MPLGARDLNGEEGQVEKKNKKDNFKRLTRVMEESVRKNMAWPRKSKFMGRKKATWELRFCCLIWPYRYLRIAVIQAENVTGSEHQQ